MKKKNKDVEQEIVEKKVMEEKKATTLECHAPATEKAKTAEQSSVSSYFDFAFPPPSADARAANDVVFPSRWRKK